MSEVAPSSRQLNGGAIAALLYAGAIFVLLVFLQAYVWTLPTDGWNMGPSGDPSTFEGKLQANVAGIPSALQPGDRVTAIDGVPIIDYMVRAYNFWRYPMPDWQDGQMLRYTVLRDKQTLDVDVPIRRIGAAGHILGSLKIAVGVINPGAAILEVIVSVAFALVSVAVFILRPRERASQALLIIGAPFFFQHYYMITSVQMLGFPLTIFWFFFLSTWILAILPGFLYLTLVFPRAKWPVRRFPRMTPLLVFGVAFLLQAGPFLIFPYNTIKALTLQRTTSFWGMLYLLLPLVAIGHSLLTERDPVAHARLKWVVLGIIGFVVGGLAFGVGGTSGWSLPVSLVQNGGYLMLPVCVAIAIVRHRMFDIDVIIRRTLVYAIVTAVLAGVFYGVVLLLQSVFASLSGQTSPVAIVASTLAIAALFSPLRGRVQGFVDRRFYRRKYDAKQVLARFATVARDETDLEDLACGLAGAVTETVQPERIGLWLRNS